MKTELSPDQTLEAVEQFLAASGMTPTSFGVRSVNDPTLVHELRRGRECRKATRLRIVEFIQRSSSADATP